VSLSNTNYLNIAKTKNIEENWLFQLFNQNSYIEFDGDDDYIDLGATTSSSPTSLTSTEDMSVSFWVKFNGASQWIYMNNSVDNNYAGVSIYVDQDRKFSFLYGDNTGVAGTDFIRFKTSTTYDDNTWYHVTITTNFFQSGTTFYVNGSSSGITTNGSGSLSPSSIQYTNGNAYIARSNPQNPDSYGNICLRNLAVWSGVLDSNNAAAIYNNGNFLSLINDYGNYNQSANLVGYWEFNNGNNIATDLTGNSAAGTIYGAYYRGFLGLSFANTKVSDSYYHGALKTSPTIRESLDLKNSIAKTSNLRISAINFKYQGFNLSEEILGSSNYYYNQTVKIYSQLNKTDDINNCMQIYHGRLSDISHTIENVSMSIIQQRPWDFITIPTDKTTDRKLLIPVAYGNYTRNSASSVSSPQFKSDLTSYAYRQVNYNKIDDTFALYPNTNSASSEAELAHYNEQFDVFIPLANAQATTINTDGAFHGKIESRFQRIFGVRPHSIDTIGSVDSRITVNNLSNAIDGNNSSFAQFTANFTTFVIAGANYYLNIDTPEEDVNFFLLRDSNGDRVVINDTGGISASDVTVTITDASNLFAGSVLKLKEEIVTVTSISSNTLTIIRGEYNTTAIAHDDQDDVYTTNNYNILHVKYEINVTAASGNNKFVLVAGNEGAFFVEDTQTSISTRTKKIPFPGFCKRIVLSVNFIGDGNTPIVGNFEIFDVYVVASRESKKPEKNLYIANDGLTSSLSDTTTVNGLVSSGLHAHRDLLARFTGYDIRDSDLYNWSSGLNVNSIRSAWLARINLLKETDLKKILEKIQKEFGFIFKFRADGTGSYWTVKASYSSGDEVETLTKNDISNIKISHTPFSELLTKIKVNYVKHPAENNYLSSVTSEDTTTSPTPRQRMNIRDKENTATINLDYNYNAPGNADVGAGSSDPADGYSDYYMNIFGDVRKIISCDIINIEKGYKFETGDIVKFNIDEIKPYGNDWSNYYMITIIKRGLRKISIECREVG